MENKVMVCSCRFAGSKKIYYYKDTGLGVCLGDVVVVPVGTNAEEKQATVIWVEAYAEGTAPYPLSKMKTVSRIVNTAYRVPKLTEIQKPRTSLSSPTATPLVRRSVKDEGLGTEILKAILFLVTLPITLTIISIGRLFGFFSEFEYPRRYND